MGEVGMEDGAQRRLSGNGPVLMRTAALAEAAVAAGGVSSEGGGSARRDATE